MKRLVAVFGAGFLAGLLIFPESRQQLRARLSSLFRAAKRQPREMRYHWRDPNARLASERAVRERMLDQTLADSFPASDPPSSIPDPLADSVVA